MPLTLAAATVTADVAQKHLLREGLTIDSVGRTGRSPVHTDAIEAEIVSGQWHRPVAGDTLRLPDGSTREWRVATADKDGRFGGRPERGGPGPGPGYTYIPVVVESNCVRVLEASGYSLVYVNGAPRTGDVYDTGYLHLPIHLRAGTNDLLFVSGRGRLKAALATPTVPVTFDLADTTFPDLIAGQKMNAWGAVVLVNATTETVTGLRIRARFQGGRDMETPIPALLPLSARKVGFRVQGRAPDSGDKVTLRLVLLSQTSSRRKPLHSVECSLRLRRPDQTQKRTFVSTIDGSVQYWALNPAQRNQPAPALFLSLHGAGVEAIGQADAYSPKTWGHIAAATNRRPYGFDWEAWGRLDALEVLRVATAELHPDPQRVYLTGHSMGGHGTWHVGALFPDHFAAIGPSAGWISLTSYAGAQRLTNASPVETLLQRAGSTSDTLAIKTNYTQEGVYILHGDADDNVPVTEARQMRDELKTFHSEVAYHEQPGAGHWWDACDEPGADCVDWAPMFDFFAHHVIPADESVRQVNFSTANPGVSASCHWLTIAQQIRQLDVSRANIRWDPGQRRFSGTTENVALLQLNLNQAQPDKPLKADLDGQKLDTIPWPAAGKLWLRKEQDRWRLDSEPPPAHKGPLRYGPFKEAFAHRMLFVYATGGTPEENAWALNKARLDAEIFYYRGNGSIDVIPDTAFDPKAEPDRSVILYGNADSNLAWTKLLSDSPVQVRRTEIRLGGRVSAGSDLACLFLRPRPGSSVACVGVVGGTGIAGCKLADRLGFFLTGAAYPDCTIIGPEMLSRGTQGIRAAGYFGLDWSLDHGEFAWRDAP